MMPFDIYGGEDVAVASVTVERYANIVLSVFTQEFILFLLGFFWSSSSFTSTSTGTSEDDYTPALDAE